MNSTCVYPISFRVRDEVVHQVVEVEVVAVAVLPPRERVHLVDVHRQKRTDFSPSAFSDTPCPTSGTPLRSYVLEAVLEGVSAWKAYGSALYRKAPVLRADAVLIDRVIFQPRDKQVQTSPRLKSLRIGLASGSHSLKSPDHGNRLRVRRPDAEDKALSCYLCRICG